MSAWVQLAASKARYLIQDPDECAVTLARAFPHPGIALEGEAYAAQMLRDHPLPAEMDAGRPDQEPDSPSM